MFDFLGVSILLLSLVAFSRFLREDDDVLAVYRHLASLAES